MLQTPLFLHTDSRYRRLATAVAVIAVYLGCPSMSYAADRGFRDPTDPSGNGGYQGAESVAESENPGLPVLSTIIFGEFSSLAVINGERIRKNDQIAGYRVKQILRKEVVLEKAGKEFRIRLPGYEVKPHRQKTMSDGLVSS